MIEIGTRGGRAGVAEQEDMDKGSSKVSGGTRIFVARIAQGITDEMFRRCGNSHALHAVIAPLCGAQCGAYGYHSLGINKLIFWGCGYWGSHFEKFGPITDSYMPKVRLTFTEASSTDT